jgi:pimeloyl-ACP methyl ester carboxylesterase
LLPFCFHVNSSLSAPQRIPNSRYREIEEAGHSVYFEKPREFNDAVLAFLKKQRLVSA